VSEGSVLVTYGWCRTAYVVCRSLAAAGYTVYVCDNSRLAMCRYSRYVEGFVRVPDPFASKRKYVDSIIDFCNRAGIDYVFPVHEDALVLRKRWDRSRTSTRLITESAEKVAIALDKATITQVAKDAGIPVPETIEYKDETELLSKAEALLRDYGHVLIKPRTGNGGKGASLARNIDEVVNILEKFKRTYGDLEDQFPIVQEYIEGEVYGGCFVAEEGEIIDYFGERYLVCKSGGRGSSVLREPCDSSVLEEYTRRLAKRLKWSGIGHFDFIGSCDDQLYLLEMNPRVWGGINHAIANGHDFPRFAIEQKIEGLSSGMICTVKGDRRSVWVLGVMIVMAEAGMRLRLREMFKTLVLLIRNSNAARDDLVWHDLPVFVAELTYYLSGFVKSRGNVNPELPEMVIKND